MNIEIKKINFNDVIDYLKDLVFILKQNLTFTFLFFILNSIFFYSDLNLSLNISSLFTFLTFLLCATIYSGGFSFISHNLKPLKLCFFYTIFVVSFVLMIDFINLLFTDTTNTIEETSDSSILNDKLFIKSFLYSLGTSVLLIISYYLFFIIYLLFFKVQSLLGASFLVPVFITNIYVFFVSYFLISFIFFFVGFFFNPENQIIIYLSFGLFISFCSLFTFIALNDILGISKTKRKIKEKIDNKNIETI